MRKDNFFFLIIKDAFNCTYVCTNILYNTVQQSTKRYKTVIRSTPYHKRNHNFYNLVIQSIHIILSRQMYCRCMEWSILQDVHVTDAALAPMHGQTRTSLLHLNHLTRQDEYVYEQRHVPHHNKLIHKIPVMQISSFSRQM